MNESVYDVVVNDRGQVVRPSLHDGHLVGIMLGDDETTVILLKAESGESYELELRGVRRLRAEEFLQGNIISGLTIRAGSDVSDEDIGHVYRLGDGPKDGEYLKAAKRSTSEEGLLHLEITPSYGCSLHAIFSEYECRHTARPRR
jgi:hypothetical protein